MKIHQITNLRNVWTTGDRISQNIYQVYEQLDLQSCSLEDKLDPKGSAIFSFSTTSSVIKCWEKGLGKKTVRHLWDHVLVIAFRINSYIIFVFDRQLRYPFLIPFIGKWYLFHIFRTCIYFNCCWCTFFFKILLYPFLVILQISLPWICVRSETPTFSYTLSLKNVETFIIIRIITVCKSYCFNKDQLTVITKKQRTILSISDISNGQAVLLRLSVSTINPLKKNSLISSKYREYWSRFT